jgi:hypothetical protein
MTPVNSIVSDKREKKQEEAIEPEIQISPEEMLKTFVSPYAQPALNGEPGLTMHDIAKSLRVPYRDLAKKLKRGETLKMFNMLKLQYVAIATYNKNNRLTEEYVFDSIASEMIVSKYENEIGWRYSFYLINCRMNLHIAKEEYRKLMNKCASQQAEIQDSQEQIKTLMAPKSRRKGSKQVKVFPEIVTRINLFGEKVYEKIMKEKTTGEMDPVECSIYRTQQIARTMKGSARAMDEILKIGKCRLGALKKDVKIVKEASERIDFRINRPDIPEPKKETQLVLR